MRIGIPKETRLEEKRVALAPAGVDSLITNGHSVFIEAGAGAGCHFTDEEYRKVGANVVYRAEEVYQRAEVITKIAPLSENETELLQEEQTIFAFHHLEISKKKVLDSLLAKKITSISYELIEADGNLNVLQTMSEIAGQVAVEIGERYLQAGLNVSRGILMGGITGVAPSAVVILGAGVVGRNAARSALGRGAQVIILDKDVNRLKNIDFLFNKRVTTVVANPYTVARGAKFADVLIGAVLIKGEKSPHVVTEEMVKSMKKGAVIVDVSIDQGGCIATSHPTSISDPIFIQHDVIHYCVPNLPALVPRTASFGLTNASIEYLINIADNGLGNALLSDAGLAKGVCTFNGFCSNEHIAEIFNFEYRRLHIFSTN
ncbi:MAG: alanine dehydrogenase [Ignavibacteriales bacterium]|nr:alanine dehydrogenase [Ignavibacteriales bacterium]